MGEKDYQQFFLVRNFYFKKIYLMFFPVEQLEIQMVWLYHPEINF